MQQTAPDPAPLAYLVERWLFDRLGDVDTHERCENFLIHDSPGSEHVTRPYAPSHGPGSNPYLVREVGTVEDVETSFLGVRDHGSAAI